MTGGSLHEPALTVAWPVRISVRWGWRALSGWDREELAAIADDDEREPRVREAKAAAQETPRRSTPRTRRDRRRHRSRRHPTDHCRDVHGRDRTRRAANVTRFVDAW